MTSKCNVLIFFAIISSISIVSAMEYVVGDDEGWTINYDYSVWTQGKDFRVGDKLVFKYPVGAHNVFKVNGTSFKSCTKPPLSEALTSGNDVIVLATEGRKWYICGVGQHCSIGQKLFINVNPELIPIVVPSASPSHAMPYKSASYRLRITFFQKVMVVIIAFVSVFLVKDR